MLQLSKKLRKLVNSAAEHSAHSALVKVLMGCVLAVGFQSVVFGQGVVDIRMLKQSGAADGQSICWSASSGFWHPCTISDGTGSVSSVFGRSGAVVAVNGDYTASYITNVPNAGISATDVQAAIDELESEKEATIAAGAISQYWRGDKTWQTLDKSSVGLGNVENTALSTWPGSTNITTLGTIVAAINSNTGFRINGTAPSGHFLLGDGAEYVDSTATILLNGTTTDVVGKNQTTAYLKDSIGNYLIYQPTYWNGSSYVATHNYGFGHFALQYNTGAYSNGFGYNALQNNTGAYSNGFGYDALQYNTGAFSEGFGYDALKNNTGAFSGGFGHYALRYNNWDNVSQFGDQTPNYFDVDPSTTQTFTDTAITGTTINIPAHGFGSSGKINLKFNLISGTAPTGLVDGTVYQFTIVDADNVSYSGIQDSGSGTFTLTNSVDTHNSIAIGNYVYPDKPNQVVIGGSSNTEMKVTGTVNSSLGFQINGTAPSGHFLRGDGTNYMDSAIQDQDLPNVSSQFDFDAQTPTVALTASTVATVTLTPCPYGVSGTNTDHYLRITDAVAGSENVLITGGTCTSGASTGTIAFTPALGHASGDWSIGSATAGIQEAIWYATDSSAPGLVRIPPGSTTVYAPIMIKSTATRKQYVKLEGSGRAATKLVFDAGTGGDGITITSVPMEFGLPDRNMYELSDLTIDFSAVTGTHSAVVIGGPTSSDGPRDCINILHDAFIYGGSPGLMITGESHKVGFSHLELLTEDAAATGIYIDSAADIIYLDNVKVYNESTGTATAYGVHLSSDNIPDLFLSDVEVLGDWYIPFFFESATDNTRANSFVNCQRCVADGTFDGGTFLAQDLTSVYFNNCWAYNRSTAATAAGYEFDNVSSGAVTGGSTARAAAKGDVSLINSSTDISIGPALLIGTSNEFYVDTTNTPTNVAISGVVVRSPLANDKPTLLAATVGVRNLFSEGQILTSSSSTGGLQFRNIDASATNPYKYMRVDNVGTLQILNSAFSSAIETLDDSGNLAITGSFTIGDPGTQPACDTTQRGKVWFDEGGTGITDSAEICDKDSSDAYAWRSLTASGSGSGDVVGPASSTDGGLTVFSGTTGKLLQEGTGCAWSSADGGTLTCGAFNTTGSGAGTITLGEGTVPTAPSTGEHTLYFDSSDSLLKSEDSASAVTTYSTGVHNAVQIQSRAVASTAPTDGQALVWNSAAGDWEPETVSSTTTHTFGCVFDGGGSTVTLNSVCYTRIPAGGTITGWSIVAQGTSPTATVDVWKVVSGTALPTSSDSITASAPPQLSSGNAVKSTTLTGWATTVTADDIAGFQVTAVSAATWVEVRIYYQ